MPAQLTTRAQVNGYRFLLRRLDHALVRRDVRMIHDPMRSQTRSLLVGLVLGILVVAGAAILAFIRPQGAIGDSLIVSGKSSGALYVVVTTKDGGKTLHPVLNLASARLIAGKSETPNSVKDAKLDSLPRGPLLGIPGAPAALPGSGQGGKSHWSICETVDAATIGSASGGLTTVIAGAPELGDRVRAAGTDEGLLVAGDDKTYLVYGSKRAEIDMDDNAVGRALGLGTQRPRPVGPGWLDATMEVPPLAAPAIDQAGKPGPGPLSDIPIGGIISVPGMGQNAAEELYVVLADGVQPVTPFAAQVIRNANSFGMSSVKSITPDVLDQVSIVHRLPVDDFPERAPRIVTVADAPVSCISWQKSPGAAPAGTEGAAGDGPGERASAGLLVGVALPIPESARPVEMVTADGSGERVDQAYIPPTHGEYVQVTGMEPGSTRRGSLFYVADNGIRYGVPDTATAQVLGLGDTPMLAPWAIVSQLVPGPTLSMSEALTSHDSLTTTK